MVSVLVDLEAFTVSVIEDSWIFREVVCNIKVYYTRSLIKFIYIMSIIKILVLKVY